MRMDLFESVTGAWAKTEAAYQTLTSRSNSCPHFEKFVQLFTLSIAPSFSCYQREGWFVASRGGRCNPTPSLPDQAHSPLHVSFTLLPPHLSAPSLCTGSNYTASAVCDRKNVCMLEGESEGEQEQATKYVCLSSWKRRSVFVNKTGGVFIVLHVWDGQSG